MAYGTNAPQGLVPRTMLNGATWNESMTVTRYIQTGYGTSLFRGDPVIITNGFITKATAGDGNPILGVFWGCEYQDTSYETQFKQVWTAGTNVVSPSLPIASATAKIIEDPLVIYDIQTTLTGITMPDAGANASLSFAMAGSAASGWSGATLDMTTQGAAANKQLKILGLSPFSNPPSPAFPNGNAFGVQYNNALVTINNGYYTAGTSGL